MVCLPSVGVAMLMVVGVGNAPTAIGQDFAHLAMSTLRAVKNLRRGAEEQAVIVVLTGSRAAAAGQALARQMELDPAAQSLMPLTAKTRTLSGSSGDGARLSELDAETPLAAVILLDPPHASIAAVMSFASQRQVLTISPRPQDTGVASLAIFGGLVYRFQRQLDSEKVNLDPSFRTTPVDSRNNLLPNGPYAKALDAMVKPGTHPDWGLLAVQFRMAIASAGTNPPKVFAFGGGKSGPFLPHLYLSKAMFKLGDCDGGDEQLMISSNREDAPEETHKEAAQEQPRCRM